MKITIQSIFGKIQTGMKEVADRLKVNLSIKKRDLIEIPFYVML
jgi:hypothetical protein